MASALGQLISSVQQQASAFVPNNDAVRQKLLDSARSLVYALESPAERIIRQYHHLLIYAVSRILIDAKVYRTLAASPDGKPQSVAQLAKATGTDVKLLERLLKFVAVEHHVDETGADEYAANDTTRLLATTEGEGPLVNCHPLFSVGDILPEYFKDRGYTNPEGKTESGFHYLHKKHYFDWVTQPGNEHELEGLKAHMRFKTLGKKWFEKTEVITSVFGDAKLSAEDVLLVDVGGSDGFDILNFHKAHPEFSGRLVLQDLPSTIDSVDVSALKAQGVEAMAHDMFTPEPIKGAKAYYLKMVLHDWPTEQCQQTLERLRDAMEPEYSRILINEIVILDQGAGWYETSLDVLMMVVHAAKERKEREWREMVEGVKGLRVRKIWEIEGAYESLIEVEKVE